VRGLIAGGCWLSSMEKEQLSHVLSSGECHGLGSDGLVWVVMDRGYGYCGTSE
jgi:hypothetical protein